MHLHVRCTAVLIISCCASALIVPEELVSLLSVIYSNIPPIRKGTDSRVGVGFRLGNSADIQFLVELGPQISTQPLGPQRNTGSSSSATPLKRQAEPVAELIKGSNWLSKWRANIERRNVAEELSETPKGQNVNNPIINEPMILHLRKLYRGDGDPDANNATDSNVVGSPQKTQKVTKDLDDVILGDK